MSLNHWLRGIKTHLHKSPGSTAHRRRTPPDRRCRPGLEILEDRCLPATLHWLGLASSLWSNPGNWAENQAPTNGDSLVFTATAFRPQSVNNLSNLSLASISFAPAAGFSGNGFTLSGNAITLGSGGISDTSTSSGTNIIQMNIAISGANRPINITRAGESVVLQGQISGTAGLNKVGTGTLVLSGPDSNTNLGDFIVDAGTVSLNKPQGKAAIGGSFFVGRDGVVRLDGTDQIPNSSDVTLDGGQLLVGDFSDVITNLNLENGRVTIGSGTLAAHFVSMIGGTIDTGTGTLQLRGDLIVPPEGSSPSSITGSTGTVNLTGSTRTFNVLNGETLTISAIIRSLTPTDGTTKTGNGELRLLGNDTYMGTTTVNKGALLVFGSQGQSPVTLNQIDLTGATLGGTGIIGPLTATSGTVSPGDTRLTGTLSVNGTAKLEAASTLRIQLGTFSDKLFATSAVTLNSPVLNVTALADGQFGGTPISIVHGSSLTGSLLNPATGRAFADGAILSVPVYGTTRTLSVTLHYTATDVTLTPFAAFPNRAITPVIDEGGVATLTGMISTPNARETFFLDVNWGDSTVKHYAFGPNEPREVSISHQYVDNPGSGASGVYAVAVSWHSSQHQGGSDTLFVTVKNLAPTIQPGGDAFDRPGGQFTRLGSFADPGLQDKWIGTVDYGDGSGPQSLLITGANQFLLHHRYTQPGTYQVIVMIYDDDGGVGSESFTVTVAAAKDNDLTRIDPRVLDAAIEGLVEPHQHRGRQIASHCRY